MPTCKHEGFAHPQVESYVRVFMLHGLCMGMDGMLQCLFLSFLFSSLRCKLDI